ncbi:hypothetical protein PMIN01_12165 [Paraphaeosphaeria minitans]|uniref:Uncharacterized protein n=1 Tax=Paraphaeosphaeria minitans TaxID=565426 RepID=A0A9P6G6Y4_9PLEO|nr:hypothetical protein PMIN01_12165 [Paraphaeosphaeria minitans]
MGHSGDVFEKYYRPTHIARDFQAILFRSPSEDLLIQSITRIGLSRDQRTPTDLDNAHREEVWNDPLQDLRALYIKQRRNTGHYPAIKGKGTEPQRYTRQRSARLLAQIKDCTSNGWTWPSGSSMTRSKRSISPTN